MILTSDLYHMAMNHQYNWTILANVALALSLRNRGTSGSTQGSGPTASFRESRPISPVLTPHRIPPLTNTRPMGGQSRHKQETLHWIIHKNMLTTSLMQPANWNIPYLEGDELTQASAMLLLHEGSITGEYQCSSGWYCCKMFVDHLDHAHSYL